MQNNSAWTVAVLRITDNPDHVSITKGYYQLHY